MSEKGYKKKIEEIDTQEIMEKQNNEKKFLLNIANDFINKEIVIKPDHDYNVNNVSRVLTINNSFFDRQKLIVDSQKTMDKLRYYLYFMINKNKAMVKNYSEKKYLENYYTYADDFIKRNDQLVFIGDLGISNWVESQQFGISNQVHTIAHPENTEPYFFSHWAINGGKPVLFQNVVDGNLGRAVAVVKKFKKDGINSGYSTEPVNVDNDITVYYFEKGILKKNGTSDIRLWKFAPNFYAALLI